MAFSCTTLRTVLTFIALIILISMFAVFWSAKRSSKSFRAKTELETQEKQLADTQKIFLELSVSFSVKPKAGEKEVSPNTFFSIWHEFSSDFKEHWKKQNKLLLQERVKKAEESFKQARQKATYNVTTKNATGIKAKLGKKI